MAINTSNPALRFNGPLPVAYGAGSPPPMTFQPLDQVKLSGNAGSLPGVMDPRQLRALVAQPAAPQLKTLEEQRAAFQQELEAARRGLHPEQQAQLRQIEQIRTQSGQAADTRFRQRSENAERTYGGDYRQAEAAYLAEKGKIESGGQSLSERSRQLSVQTMAERQKLTPAVADQMDGIHRLENRVEAVRRAGPSYQQELKLAEKELADARGRAGLDEPESSKGESTRKAEAYLDLRRQAEQTGREGQRYATLAKDPESRQKALDENQARFDRQAAPYRGEMDAAGRERDDNKAGADRNAAQSRQGVVDRQVARLENERTSRRVQVPASDLPAAARQSEGYREAFGAQPTTVESDLDGRQMRVQSSGRSLTFRRQEDGSLDYGTGRVQEKADGSWVETRGQVTAEHRDGVTKTHQPTYGKGYRDETVEANGDRKSVEIEDSGRKITREVHGNVETERTEEVNGNSSYRTDSRKEARADGSVRETRRSVSERNGEVVGTKEVTRLTGKDGQSQEQVVSERTNGAYSEHQVEAYQNGKLQSSDYVTKRGDTVASRHQVRYDAEGRATTTSERYDRPKAVTEEPDVNGLAHVPWTTTPQNLVRQVASDFLSEPVTEQTSEMKVSSPDGKVHTSTSTTYANDSKGVHLVCTQTEHGQIHELQKRKVVNGQEVWDSQTFFEGDDKDTIIVKHGVNSLGWVERHEESRMPGVQQAKEGKIPVHSDKRTTSSDSAHLKDVRTLLGPDAAQVERSEEMKAFRELTQNGELKVQWESTDGQFADQSHKGGYKGIVTGPKGEKLCIQRDENGVLAVSLQAQQEKGLEQSMTVSAGGETVRFQRPAGSSEVSAVVGTTKTVLSVGQKGRLAANALRAEEGFFSACIKGSGELKTLKLASRLGPVCFGMDSLNVAADLISGDTAKLGRDTAQLGVGAAQWNIAIEAARKASGATQVAGGIGAACKVFGVAGALAQVGYGIADLQDDKVKGSLEIVGGAATGTAIVATWAGASTVPVAGWIVAAAATAGLFTWGMVTDSKVHDVVI